MKQILTILLITLCNIISGQSHHEMLKNAPIVESIECEKEGQFKQVICSFKDIDTVKYIHINSSPVDDFKSVKDSIDRSFRETFLKANKIAVEVKDPLNVDIVIKYEYLDGIDGTLAKAHFPSCNPDFVQVMTFDNYDMPPGENTPDSVLIYYNNIKDICVITKHEAGHLLGFKHNHEDRLSMMYPYYDPKATWSKDDNIGFKVNYARRFYYISKDSNYPITQNFNVSEFFSKCEGMNFHFLDSKLIITAQKLRDMYGSGIIITSTYRHTNCNKAAGGASRSRHLSGRAVDIKFIDKTAHLKFISDVTENGYVVKILKNSKIGGVGLYNSHIHLDTRVGNLIVFDKRSELNSEGEGVNCGL